MEFGLADYIFFTGSFLYGLSLLTAMSFRFFKIGPSSPCGKILFNLFALTFFSGIVFMMITGLIMMFGG